MAKGFTIAALVVASAALAVFGAALLAAAAQLGFDLSGSRAAKTIETGGGTLTIGDAELLVSFTIALTLGLLLAVPSYLFGRRALRLIRGR